MTLKTAVMRVFRLIGARSLFLAVSLLAAQSLCAQVAVTLNPYSRQQFLDVNGKPLAGGCVFTYQAGTSTPLATYTDSTGLFQNANPLILDSAGEGVLWLSASAYRIVLFSAGGVACASGAQQWLLDFVTPPPFLSGNNFWTGNNTLSGTTTFSGAAVFNAGGTFNGTFAGSPNFSGNPTFSGLPAFSNLLSLPNGVAADTINGITAGGTMAITATNGSGGAGEQITETAGAGAAGFAGGALIEKAGNGGSGTIGGAVSVTAGNGGSGNSPGANATFGAGNASGSGTGGSVTVSAGSGATGGDVFLPAGVGGGGSTAGRVFVQNGHMVAQSTAPACASTGIGGTGTCILAGASTDNDGAVILQVSGAAPAAAGAITLTFSRPMTLITFCVAAPNQTNGGQWNARATIFQAIQGTTNVVLNWDNNAVALTAASSYNVSYHCMGL